MEIIKKNVIEEPDKQMWCCAWGVNKSEEKDDSALAKARPKEFVVIGGIQPQLKIVSISSSEKNVFPYELPLHLPGMGVHQVAISPDSSCIAAVSLEGKLMLLDVKEGVRLPNVSHNVNSNFWSAAFSGCNDCVYGGSGNGKIHKYDTLLGQLQGSYDTQRSCNIMGLAISSDQTLVAATDYAGNFTLLDGATGQIVGRQNYRAPLRRLVFDVGMRFALAACDDKTIKVIDLPSGRLRESIPGHDAYVMSVDTSSDGHRFVSGAFDGSIKLWDSRSSKCVVDFFCGANTNLWDVAFNKLSNKISIVGDGKGLNVYYYLGNRELILV